MTQSPMRGSFVGQLHVGKVLAAFHLQQRDIGHRIGADHLGVMRRAVIHDDLHFHCLVDDMVVRHQIAIRRDEEAGAQRLRELMGSVRAIAEPLAVGTLRSEIP